MTSIQETSAEFQKAPEHAWLQVSSRHSAPNAAVSKQQVEALWGGGGGGGLPRRDLFCPPLCEMELHASCHLKHVHLLRWHDACKFAGASSML